MVDEREVKKNCQVNPIGLISDDCRPSYNNTAENVIYLTSKSFIENTLYIDLGISIKDLTPKDFKKSYKGDYSNLFKSVKEHHNIDLGLKSQDDLKKLMKIMNYYGIIYKITQIKDEKGNYIHNGISWVREDGIIKAGYHRIGRSRDLDDRFILYGRNQTGNYFENTFQKLGEDAFNFNILAVCKTQKEYVATEYFWQLYFNRESNALGYDLLNNGNFNPRLGSMYDDVSNPILSKYTLVKDILDGLDRFELDLKYKHLKNIVSIKHVLLRNFEIESIFSIRCMLVVPMLENSLLRGLTEQETIEKLIDSGFGMFDNNQIQLRINTYGQSSTRTNPENLFDRILLEIYSSPKIKPTRVFTHYEQLRKIKFFDNCIEFLKSKKLELTINESEKDENKLSLTDFLFERGLSPKYILEYLGLKYNEDEAKKIIRKMENYLNRRWTYLINDFSRDKLKLYLNDHPLIISTINTYLNKKNLNVYKKKKGMENSDKNRFPSSNLFRYDNLEEQANKANNYKYWAESSKSLEDMKQLALDFLNNGKCLSDQYKGSHNPLLWECGLCKNQFLKSPSNLKRTDGYGGCPNCREIKNMSNLHIEMLKYLNLINNSKLVSTENIGSHFGYSYDKALRIIRILLKKEFVERSELSRDPGITYGYKISPTGIAILRLHKILTNKE